MTMIYLDLYLEENNEKNIPTEQTQEIAYVHGFRERECPLKMAEEF